MRDANVRRKLSDPSQEHSQAFGQIEPGETPGKYIKEDPVRIRIRAKLSEQKEESSAGASPA